MTKKELISVFIRNHQEVIDYFNNLDDHQFIYGHNGKWTAGQQLQHILLTIIPFSKVLPSKEFIREKFGNINRPTWNYETVLDQYSKTSLQAPEQFYPGMKWNRAKKNRSFPAFKKILNVYRMYGTPIRKMSLTS